MGWSCLPLTAVCSSNPCTAACAATESLARVCLEQGLETVSHRRFRGVHLSVGLAQAQSPATGTSSASGSASPSTALHTPVTPSPAPRAASQLIPATFAASFDQIMAHRLFCACAAHAVLATESGRLSMQCSGAGTHGPGSGRGAGADLSAGQEPYGLPVEAMQGAPGKCLPARMAAGFRACVSTEGTPPHGGGCARNAACMVPVLLRGEQMFKVCPCLCPCVSYAPETHSVAVFSACWPCSAYFLAEQELS
jgi:hypothetical protein